MSDSPIRFYFDLASPLAYLAAEEIPRLLPAADWLPVLERDLPGAVSGPAGAFRCENEEQICRAAIERRAQQLGLQPLRWPADFPFDSERAMQVATYARSIGRGIPFARAAFRQAFAGGHSLGDVDFVLIAAAACEMHPRAVLQSAGRPAVHEELERATAQAQEAGVASLPAVQLDGRIFEGDGALRDAAHSAGQAAGGRS